MESIREIYRVGIGPSSSHTMGPRKAAEIFLSKNPEADHYSASLYSSLAATGKGHLTDWAIHQVFEGKKLEINWIPERRLVLHPNGMKFRAFDAENNVLDAWEVYSIGGGALTDAESDEQISDTYNLKNMREILSHCEEEGLTFWEYVYAQEGGEIKEFLQDILKKMFTSIENGLENEGALPGGIGLPRKASSMLRKVRMAGPHFKRGGLLSAYALAVSEENAAGGTIVTAPTCGSCGVMPSILRYVKESVHCSEAELIKALATAGLIGNLVKQNASISGAQVGCQGEIGTASAMAAAAAVQLMGGSIRQIEYAAEMGLEHHLGLTCDPVYGLVQIPCIERNAFAAKRALSCAEYALFSDGVHRIQFDDVVEVMNRTGNDLPSLYRETAEGGLAAVYQKLKPEGGFCPANLPDNDKTVK